jgi:hypothetical protein
MHIGKFLSNFMYRIILIKKKNFTYSYILNHRDYLNKNKMIQNIHANAS